MEFWEVTCPKRAARATAEVKANATASVQTRRLIDRNHQMHECIERSTVSGRQLWPQICVEFANADKLPGAIAGPFLT
jgi:hypothetical protein